MNIISGFELSSNISTSTKITPLAQVKAIASSTNGGGGVFLMTDGTVRTCGENNWGQCGLGTTSTISTPTQISGISSAVAVASGTQHIAIVMADGTVFCAGRGDAGMLGNGTVVGSSTPVQALNISTATAVACGDKHTIVLLQNGTVWAWGVGTNGQLGDNQNTTTTATPVQVWNISSSATAVAAGRYWSMVLLTDGTIRTFGRGVDAQHGDGTTLNSSTPVQVANISTATGIACGAGHGLAVLSNGTVWSWGRGSNGQLGNNSTTTASTPVQVWTISSLATAVAAGRYHSVALSSDGTVRSFGQNSRYQLGLGDATQRNTPVAISGVTSATKVSSIRYGSGLVLTDGTCRTCGQNTNGQLGDGTTNLPNTPITPIDPSKYYLVSSNLYLGVTTATAYQLDMSTDYARKLTTSTWLTGSDERVKTEIKSANLDRCFEIVDALDLKRFEWNTSQKPRDANALGWIAQDVKEFFPKSVIIEENQGLDDFHNLDTDQLIKVMYGSLKKMVRDVYPTQEES
jgi:alpha-tubulin suppressor-like RCC1 family protein